MGEVGQSCARVDWTGLDAAGVQPRCLLPTLSVGHLT